MSEGMVPPRQQEEDIAKRIAKFHAHLDVCPQCRYHCFNLCPIGAKLLKYAATGQYDEVVR